MILYRLFSDTDKNESRLQYLQDWWFARKFHILIKKQLLKKWLSSLSKELFPSIFYY